jgi:hypothetical protein
MSEIWTHNFSADRSLIAQAVVNPTTNYDNDQDGVP